MAPILSTSSVGTYLVKDHDNSPYIHDRSLSGSQCCSVATGAEACPPFDDRRKVPRHVLLWLVAWRMSFWKSDYPTEVDETGTM
jgi:hypothetical protein